MISMQSQDQKETKPAGAQCASGQEPIPAVDKMTSRQRFLNASRCLEVDRPPVWLMRQAGRALPEYRKLKEKYSFLDLVRNPDLATEVTLQPIRRFGFDAAILFSDILVIPEAMGQGYSFRDQGGIQMDAPLKSAEDIDRLNPSGVRDRLQYVYDALRLIKADVGDRTALLGFAGSPWTLANFMLEGGSAKEFTQAKLLFHSEPELFQQLMEKLTSSVTEYLQLQIDAGVDAIQIFDSLGGNLAHHSFEAASACWIRQIIASLDGKVPVILFSRGTHSNWDVLADTGCNVLGIDWMVSLSKVQAGLPKGIGVQGNLDPVLLNTTPETVRAETNRILLEMSGKPGHIFNLGHGVPPTAKLENIESLVETVHCFK